ncbi:MAG: alpha/beta hydrolase family protein [Anaerolineae bacterium]
MKRILTIATILVACGLALGQAPALHAEDAPELPDSWAGFADRCDAAYIDSGNARYPDDQAVTVCFPDNWNGTLVVYAHGYVSPRDVPGVVVEEIGLPDYEADLLAGVIPTVLDLGFATATTGYSKLGWALEPAQDNILTLVDHFKDNYSPDGKAKVLMVGASEGGIITTMMLERFPETFAGGLSLCGVVGGAPYQFAYIGDFRVVFDYYFPDVFDFGAADIPADAYEDWVTTPEEAGSPVILPEAAAAFEADPAAVDELFAVTDAPADPANLDATRQNTMQQILFYNIWGSEDAFETTGGSPFRNVFTYYYGSSDDRALNRGVERLWGDSSARSYAREYYETTGDLERPLITIHNRYDPAVPFEHEIIYLLRTAFQGNLGNLLVIPPGLLAEDYGHCNFTETETLVAFGLLVLRTLNAEPSAAVDIQADALRRGIPHGHRLDALERVSARFTQQLYLDNNSE